MVSPLFLKNILIWMTNYMITLNFLNIINGKLNATEDQILQSLQKKNFLFLQLTVTLDSMALHSDPLFS